MSATRAEPANLPVDMQSKPIPQSNLQRLLGVERASHMPQRIQQAISAQDHSSEVLIKVIQLIIVLMFAALYFISPKTDAGTSFSPVPYALALYFVLNMIGLIWAWRWGLPNWSVYISVFFDMSLLMVLIWSFHIQYNQPASFYLKAPTLLYVFIFIALRVLRFQARFVAAAGLMAALFWFAMMYYAISVNPQDSMITRNYVTYLTHNSVLLGAEFDKIITILMVTSVLVLALVRARSLLVRATLEQTAAQDLSRFFDQGVAERIRHSEQAISAGDGIKRDAAILNVDIRGFTVMAADADAGEVMQTLADYQRRLVPLIQHNGGVIDKFLGDGIMATFGAVSTSHSYAADALRAIDAIIADTTRWADEEPRLAHLGQGAVNLAVATGAVVFGAVGDDRRLEYTVIGSAVNLSAKLEKHNKALGSRALATAPCYELALRQGYKAEAAPEFADADLGGLAKSQKIVVLHR